MKSGKEIILLAKIYRIKGLRIKATHLLINYLVESNFLMREQYSNADTHLRVRITQNGMCRALKAWF